MQLSDWINGGKERVRSFLNLKRKRELTLAFNACFKDADGKLTDDAKTVITYLRDVSHARGEIRNTQGKSLNRTPSGMFDKDGVIFDAGQQRLFWLIIQHLSLDELELFNLRSRLDDDDEFLIRKLII